MQPIHELLSRIHWDRKFAEADFELDIYDRLEDRLIRMPVGEIIQVTGEHHMFHYRDEEGVDHSVPFHRIKSVYRDGERIWHREH